MKSNAPPEPTRSPALLLLRIADHRYLEALIAKKFLHAADSRAILKQMGRKRMPRRMAVYRLAEACWPRSLPLLLFVTFRDDMMSPHDGLATFTCRAGVFSRSLARHNPLPGEIPPPAARRMELPGPATKF